MNTNSSQVPSPLPEARKHSRLGIGSLVFAIVALLVTGIFMFSGGLPLSFGFYASEHILGLLLLGGLLTTLVGIGLSIVSMRQKGTNKMFGILGLVISGIILLGFCAYGIFLISFLSGMY